MPTDETDFRHRFSGLVDLEAAAKVPIFQVGAGAIGNTVAQSLVRTGFENLSTMDFDKVDPINVMPQWYTVRDLGEFKVHALGRRINEDLDVSITTLVDKFESEEQIPEGTRFIIPAVDSIVVRKCIFDAALKTEGVDHIVDGRMGARSGEMYAVWLADGEGVEKYAATLSSEGVADLPCSERSTPYCAAALGNMMVAYIASAFRGEQEEVFQAFRVSMFNPAGLLFPVS